MPRFKPSPRSVVFAASLVATAAFAQAPPVPPAPVTSEWTSPVQPPPLAPAPAAPAPPASANKVVPPPTVPPPTVPAPAPVTPPQAPADVAAVPGTTTQESFVPGSEPHSPATRGNKVSEPANLRVMSGVSGASGVWRVSSADLGRPGLLRLSLDGEYFTSQNFPVLRARNTRTAGTLTAGYVFHKNVEGYFSYAASANTNSKASPPLMQAQGDVNLGIKAATEVTRGFRAGADLAFNLFPGLGAQDVSRYAFGFSPRLLATYDVRAAAPSVPLRAHLNLSLNLDGTGDFGKAKVLTPSEEFALGVNRFNRFGMSLGIESPLPYATAFLEFGFAYPMGAGGLVGPDGNPVGAGSAMPNRLTLGGKVTALRDVGFVAAIDLGLASRVASGIPATMPYNLIFGITYNIDPQAKGETRIVEKTTVVEKKVEVATVAPSYTGKVGGAVLDADTKQPVAGAVVAMAGSGLPPVASDVDGGKFLSYELPAGKVELTAVKDGYRPAAQEAVIEVGKVASVQFLLTREVKGSAVRIALTSNRAKVDGRLRFEGPRRAEIDTVGGAASLELPAGHYVLAVEASGYLAKSKELELTGAEARLDFDLSPVPRQSLVEVRENRIEIKQQVHFETAKATILGDSFALLDQVIDAIVRSGARKVRIEGHTDNHGAKDANLRLSQDRAKEVLRYLVSRGVDRTRVDAEGYGDSKPIAPNLTARGREKNRRVDFVIVER
jgi:outer membrane protein OmpA-like peptidoglycan-associated protein